MVEKDLYSLPASLRSFNRRSGSVASNSLVFPNSVLLVETSFDRQSITSSKKDSLSIKPGSRRRASVSGYESVSSRSSSPDSEIMLYANFMRLSVRVPDFTSDSSSVLPSPNADRVRTTSVSLSSPIDEPNLPIKFPVLPISSQSSADSQDRRFSSLSIGSPKRRARRLTMPSLRTDILL